MSAEKVWNILKIVGIALLTTLFAAYIIFAIVMSDRWKGDVTCKNLFIDITDYNQYKFIDQNGVFNYISAAKMNPEGKEITIGLLDRLEKSVERIHVVRRAECYADVNGNIIIKVTQRKPEYRVINNQGKSYYVDSDRHVMPSTGKFATKVPLVTGCVTEDMAETTLFDMVQYILKDSFWKNHIGQINITEKGNIELITKMGVKKILLNDMTTYRTKLKIARKMYEKYPLKAWSDQYTVMDLRYDNLIYCKKAE